MYHIPIGILLMEDNSDGAELNPAANNFIVKPVKFCRLYTGNYEARESLIIVK